MKIPWPPSEHDGWSIEETKETTNIFHFPLFRHDKVLLSIYIRNKDVNESINAKIYLQNKTYFECIISYNTWTALPYPIETHANGTFWSHITLESSNTPFQIEWGFFPWSQRQFRMRGLIDETGILVAAYRFNKNGQVITFIPIKDEQMTLPEDTVLIPQVKYINTQSIILQSSRTTIQTKKADTQLCPRETMTLRSADSV